ncbi:MAG TPA: hypothetical protein VJ476_13555 [Rhizomicrobium sp.]|nr:hypothetical protein [Rhizomicrobium sp.]
MLAATAIAVSAGSASAEPGHLSNDNERGHDGRGNVAITLGFDDVAFGYRDGYWDNDHHWHRWNNNAAYRNYRDHGTNYHGWKHNRDSNHGWLKL